MFDKDKRRIIRATQNPLQTATRLSWLAVMWGCTFEEAAAVVLQSALDAYWDDLDDENPFAIDCDCCRDLREEEAAAAAANQVDGHA